MIIHYKNPSLNIKRLTPLTITKVHRRNTKVKKLTKTNKEFLKSLGFKV